MPRRVLPDGGSRVRIGAALVLFVYLAILRTRHISETFWLLGDQILYWRMALGSWHDLPMGGGPSSVGGTTLGPVFLWIMWAVRHSIGPWTENLPHAGGIGVSIIQSAADAVLFIAIWKRFASLALALSVTLLVATSPFDMALSATIWNPPIAVAFIKMAIASILLSEQDASIAWGAAATGSALMAVQCHSSAIFFAAPAIVSLPGREFLAKRRRRALQYACASAAVILVLETPFLLDRALHPGKQTSPSKVVGSIAYTFQHPELLRPTAALRGLASACEFILLRPWSSVWFGTLLLLCAAVTAVRTRHDVSLACVTIVPLVFAVAGFSFWQSFFDSYWFLTIAPSAALTIAMALTAWRPAATILAAALALVVVAAQPARLADSMTMFRLPQYGPLVRGSREIRRRAAEVRSIELEFPLPPSTDPYFIYKEVLGGRISPTAPFAATIESTGRVRFTPAP